MKALIRDWAVVVALAIVALIGVGKVGEDVFAHETTSFDGAVQAWALAHQAAVLTPVFVFITTIGSVASMSILALAGSLFLAVRGHRRVAAGALVAPAVAVVLFTLVKRVYARTRPAGLGGIVPSSYAFPSGHATGSTAVCCTLAYVLWREGYISRPVALTIAILPPLLIGASRIYLNVHWATDVIGGWSAGLLIAVFFAGLHDRHRRRHVPDAGASMPLLRAS
ncbi:MAG: phosphatase PAP2 family protein [Gemmatimonadaceae bacterium]|nr:phosphatase PAP2 family protein [Gemmatimonadaceae bacterium]